MFSKPGGQAISYDPILFDNHVLIAITPGFSYLIQTRE